MGKKAFEKIAEGLNEALAIARGKAKPARVRVPNAKTRAAMKEIERGNLQRFNAVEDLMAELKTRRAKRVGKGKAPGNDWQVVRSMEQGDHVFHAGLSKKLAERYAAVLQEIEDDRRSRAKDKRLREDPGAFDIYYIRRDPKKKRRAPP